MDSGSIGDRQLMGLATILIYSTGVMFLPSITGREAREDAWMASLLATALGVGFGVLMGALARRFPGRNPADYGLQLLGPVFGRLVILILVWFSLQSAAIVAREFAEVVITLMPETPIIVFVSIQVWVACMAVRNGIEVIARVNEVWLPILLIAAVVVIALVINHADWRMIGPSLARGLAPVMRATVTPTAWMGETVVLLFALSNLDHPNEGTGSLVKGIVLAGVLMTVEAAVAIAVMGPEQVGRIPFPILWLSRLVDIARFITRIESLTIVLWLVGTMVKVALFMYAAAVGLARIVKLDEYRPLVFPLGALATSLAIGMFPDLPNMIAYISGPFAPFALSVELGVPLLLLGASWIRGARRPAAAGQGPSQ